MGIVDDVVLGGFQAGVLTQGDDAQVLEQQQGAALVGGVVGHSDDSPVGDVLQGVALAGIDAHGLIVDGAGVHQVSASLSVEVFHVGDVLEEVGVILPFLHGGVGHDIVVVGADLQGDALLSQVVHHLLQDLLVGGAAGGQTQAQGEGHGQCKKLLHVGCSSF